MSMRNRKGKILPAAMIIGLTVCLATPFAFAGQSDDMAPEKAKWTLELTLSGAVPSGEFMDNLGHFGLGLGLAVGRRLGRSPLVAGIDASFFIYGLRSRDEALTGDIPLQVDVETTNNIVQGLLFLRLEPYRGRVRPYIEALAGFSYFYTETSISDNEYPYDEIASDTNFDDGAFCAGGGAGLDIHLGGGSRPFGRRTAETRLDFKIRYLLGGRAKYLRDDSIVYENGEYTYLYRESRTNLVTAQVGLLINF